MTSSDIRQDVSVGNRLLANEDVLDAFGHVSLRAPGRPDRFFLARSLAPELVQPADVLEFDLDSEPVGPAGVALYSERVIHGAIYRQRPDVMAICHHHAPAIMPFAIAGAPLVPVFQHGATIGAGVPFWDSREAFGDTNLLVTTSAQADSLAAALGSNAMVIMRRHGATVVGGSLTELVFRAINSCRNAEYQWRAQLLGHVDALTAGEQKLAASIPAGPMQRAWDYWLARLPNSGA